MCLHSVSNETENLICSFLPSFACAHKWICKSTNVQALELAAQLRRSSNKKKEKQIDYNVISVYAFVVAFANEHYEHEWMNTVHKYTQKTTHRLQIDKYGKMRKTSETRIWEKNNDEIEIWKSGQSSVWIIDLNSLFFYIPICSMLFMGEKST